MLGLELNEFIVTNYVFIMFVYEFREIISFLTFSVFFYTLAFTMKNLDNFFFVCVFCLLINKIYWIFPKKNLKDVRNKYLNIFFF